MIVENDQSAPGAWVWIGVQDTDALYDEILKNGGMIRVKPTNYWWAYEMQVDDLDGNVLRFGAENKENEPYGPWLDAQNNLWVMNDEKVWTKKD
ncbi:Glyoxalase-like domain protein [compost metagenome]